jgi:fatty acid desaturase
LLKSPPVKDSAPGVSLRSDAAPARRASVAARASDWRGAAALARDWGAIAALAWLGRRVPGPLAYVAIVWLIGAFQFAIGECLLHEASHYNLFRTRSWNDRLEFLYALPFFMTLAQFREEHLAHHRDVGTPQDELLADYRLLGLERPDANMFWIWFVKPLTGFAGYFYLTKLSLRPWKCGLKLALFWGAVAAAALHFGALRVVALYWLVPLWWCHTSYLYWSEIQDHFGTRAGTRSIVGRLNNRLFHNNGYHAAHHARPGVPWYRLPDEHRDYVASGKHHPRDLSSGFLDTYRQLRSAARA